MYLDLVIHRYAAVTSSAGLEINRGACRVASLKSACSSEFCACCPRLGTSRCRQMKPGMFLKCPNANAGSPENSGSCENTSLRVLLLTDSDKTEGILRAMVHALGADSTTHRVTNMDEVIAAARHEQWDVLIAHWRPGKAQKPATGEIADRLGGRIRRIEIETRGRNLTLAALRAGTPELSEDGDWLVFTAHSVLRKSRGEAGVRFRGAMSYKARCNLCHGLPQSERE